MLLIALGRVAQFILLFATIKFSTTLLPPDEIAKVYMVASLVAFYAMLFLNPVGMFINRRLHAWNLAGAIQHYFRYFWIYLLVVCGIAILSLKIFVEFKWVDLHTSVSWALMLVGGSLLFSTVNQVVIPGLNLLGFRGWFVALTLATTAMSLMAATILVVEFSPKAENWICGILLGQLILSVIGWKVFFGKLNPPSFSHQPTRQHFKKLVDFSWPISIAVGLGWAQTQSYRFMMESGLGMHALGLFSAGYSISAGIISAFESLFTIYLHPKFYKKISSEDMHEQSNAWSEYAGTIFPSMLLVGFFTLTMAPELSRIMLGAEYWSAYQFIAWGVIAEVARVASGVYGMAAHASMKTRLLVAPSLAGAFASIALIWWLMPTYGSNGVGGALMIGSVAAFALTYASTRNELVSTLPIRAIVISVVMGLMLMALAGIWRLIIHDSRSLMMTVAMLGTVGMVFLYFQYTLLRPILRGDMANK